MPRTPQTQRETRAPPNSAGTPRLRCFMLPMPQWVGLRWIYPTQNPNHTQATGVPMTASKALHHASLIIAELATMGRGKGDRNAVLLGAVAEMLANLRRGLGGGALPPEACAVEGDCLVVPCAGLRVRLNSELVASLRGAINARKRRTVGNGSTVIRNRTG